MSAQLSCHVCPFVCNDSTVLARHILAHPAEEEAAAASKSSSASSEVPIIRLSCSTCGTFVDSFEELQAHRRTCTGGSDKEQQQSQKRSSLGSSVQHTTLSCSTCGVFSGSPEELQIHTRSCLKSSLGGKLAQNRSPSVEIDRTFESSKNKVIGMDYSEKMSRNEFLRTRYLLKEGTEENAGNGSRRLSGGLEHGQKRLGLARQETMDKLRKSLTIQNDGEQISTTTLVQERSRDSLDLSPSSSHTTDQEGIETLDLALARSLAVPSLFYSSTQKRYEAQNQNKNADMSFSKTDLTVQNRVGDASDGIPKLQEHDSERDIAVNLSRDSLIVTSATGNENAKYKVKEKQDKTSSSRSVGGSVAEIHTATSETGSHIDTSLKRNAASSTIDSGSNGRTKACSAPKPASAGRYNSECIVHMSDGEEFFIKEEPDSPSPAVGVEQEREETVEMFPNTEGVVASASSSGRQDHEGMGQHVVLCAVCDRAFPSKSLVIRHMHETHGLPLQTSHVRQGPKSSTVQSVGHRDSDPCSKSPRVTGSCVGSSREAATPYGGFGATEPITSSLLVHSGALCRVYPPSTNPQANGVHSRNQGCQESPAINLHRQTSQSPSSSLQNPQHPRVTQQPPVSGRYAKLVSSFDDFSARPYACSLCFFRTASLRELRLHVHNHLTGGSTTDHIPATARLAKPDDVLRIQRSSPVKLDVQNEDDPQIPQRNSGVSVLPVSRCELFPTHNPAAVSPVPGTQTPLPTNASSVTGDRFLSVGKPNKREAFPNSLTSNIDDCSEMDVDNEDLTPVSRQTTSITEQSSRDVRAASPECSKVPGAVGIGETRGASPGTERMESKSCEAVARETTADPAGNSARRDEHPANTREFVASEKASDKPSLENASVHNSPQSEITLHGRVPTTEFDVGESYHWKSASSSPAISVSQRNPGESAERRSISAAESEDAMDLQTEARESSTPVAVVAMDGASCREAVHTTDREPTSSQNVDVIQEDNSPSKFVNCQKTSDLQTEDYRNKSDLSTDILSFLPLPASQLQENRKEKETKDEPQIQKDSEKDTFISHSSPPGLSVQAISSFQVDMEHSGTNCVLGRKESLGTAKSTDEVSIDCDPAVTSEKLENTYPGGEDVDSVCSESEERTLGREHRDCPAESSGRGLLATDRHSRAMRAKGKKASLNAEHVLGRKRVLRKSDKTVQNCHDQKVQKTQFPSAFWHNATRPKRGHKNTFLSRKTTPLVSSKEVTDKSGISNTSTVPLHAGKNRLRKVYRAMTCMTADNKQERSRCHRCCKWFSLKALCNRHMKFCGFEK